MSSSWREYRILDKDLGRFSHAERASSHAARPLLRVGIAAVFVAAVVLVALGVYAGQPGLATIAAATAIAAYLAISIGGNDVANSLAPAVGAGALPVGRALVLAAIAEVLGASLAGDAVAGRLAGGIIVADALPQDVIPAQLMLSALLAAAIWISLSTWIGTPVSTTHSIVGGIVGAGLAAFGAGTLSWPTIALIASSWLISPLIAGGLAALLLAFLRHRVESAPDRLGAALRWLPVLIALMGVSFTFYVTGVTLAWPFALSAPVSLGAAWLVWLYARRKLAWQIAQGPAQSRKKELRRVFGVPLTASAMLMAFAHGANDVGNVAGPLSVILRAGGAATAPDMAIPLWVLLVAAGGIALGILLFGRRLVLMVGAGITKLNPARAFCIALATAVTVIAASGAGLPVSTTHVTVGGVFGVGFYREWDDRRRRKRRESLPVEERRRRHLVRRSYVTTILATWMVTVPATASLSALCAWATRGWFL